MKLIDIQRHFFRLSDRPGNIYWCKSADTDIALNVKKLHCLPCTANMEIVSSADEFTVYNKDLHKVMPLEATLGMAYEPAANIHSMHAEMPDSLGEDCKEALTKLKECVGNVADFVCERLQWSHDELEERLFAEQADAVALAIYNFEARNQAMIIGDQTGIGKGRIAATILHYARIHSYIPVYCTQDAGLFSDTVYRDLCDIGEPDMKPFIMNSDSKAVIKVLQPDDTYKVVFRPITDLKAKAQILTNSRITKSIPIGYDYILTTYSQLNKTWKMEGQGKNKKEVEGDDWDKYMFFRAIAPKALFVFDESHNLSGSKAMAVNWRDPSKGFEVKGSHQFRAFSELAKLSGKVLFLSATFAKRPENMIVYAENTSIKETGLTDVELVQAMQNAGEALQEIMSGNIVREGQMIRRESNPGNIDPPNYIELSKKGQEKYPDLDIPDCEKEHKDKCDQITELIRRINKFEAEYVTPIISAMAEMLHENAEVEKSENNMGVSHAPIFSKLHMMTAELLYCIKAEAVAEHTLMRLRQGKKVVIALSNTMDAFLDPKKNEGIRIGKSGQKLDFSAVLQRAVELTRRYTLRDLDSKEKFAAKMIDIADLSPDGQKYYNELTKDINDFSSNISISPIDLIEHKIKAEGWDYAEVTGRSYCVEFDDNTYKTGTVRKRTPEKKNLAFSKFQNNKVDVLIINKSGSTGASAHATTKNTNLRPDQVKQRCMIIAQAELDINDEVQKRGRINRTGQIKELPPIYDYLISAIPAERRLMMILQKKLRSLDANTTSNQKQSTNIIDVPDFFNKYGNEICIQYLTEHKEINEAMNDPLSITEKNDKNSMEETESSSGEISKGPDFLKKVTGYVPLLKCSEQENFYKIITEQYIKKIDDLKAHGDYDLEVETMDLDAIRQGDLKMIVEQANGKSNFSDAVYMGVYDCNNLKKPFNQKQIKARLNVVSGKTPQEYAKETCEEIREYFKQKNADEIAQIQDQTKVKLAEVQREIEEAEKTGKPISEDEQNKKRNECMKKSRERIEVAKGKQLKLSNKLNYIDFFWAGRACRDENDVPMICLGCETLGQSMYNSYTPSQIYFSFAVANGTRQVVYNLADKGADALSKIRQKTESINIEPEELAKTYFEEWPRYCKESDKTRVNRNIMTGNILKACGKATEMGYDHYQLVNFTTHSGDVLKGLLLPVTDKDTTNTIILTSVSIDKFGSIFANDIKTGRQTIYNLSGGIELETNKRANDIYITIPRGKYYDFILDNCLDDFNSIDKRGRSLQEEKKSGKKVANVLVDKKNLVPLLKLLSIKLHIGVELNPGEVEKLFPSKKELKTGNWPELETDPTLIPPNTSLQEGEFMFLNVL